MAESHPQRGQTECPVSPSLWLLRSLLLGSQRIGLASRWDGCELPVLSGSHLKPPATLRAHLSPDPHHPR